MTAVTTIIDELNLSNGLNHKMAVLKKYKDHELFKRVLKLAYDKAAYTFGISMKNVEFVTTPGEVLSLEKALENLEERLAPRHITGNAARDLLEGMFRNLSPENADLLKKIINRDLRINLGRSSINKVWSQLITKPAYMRCGLYSAKTAKDIPMPAILQLKADGTYREASVADGTVTFVSRSGETYEYPVLEAAMADFPDGRYFGELVVIRDGKALDRATGNGLINSDDVPHNEIFYFVWDYVTHAEYFLAMNKGKPKTKYEDRLAKLCSILENSDSKQIELIEGHEVGSIRQALQITSNWMEAGFEGSILKAREGVFKDGTSKHQLKLKLEIAIDVRITGFKEGRVGTVRENTFGALEFATDDGQIKGYCSGLTNDLLEDFNSRRGELIGQVMEVLCNDITKGRDNDYYALSHPRFSELRHDKTETDTLARALESKEMAMAVGEK